MNLFIKKIAKLLIATFLLLVIAIIFKERDFISTPKRYLFESKKNTVECLITGTSHAFWGINPKLFPIKTINIAEKNKPIEIDIEIIEKNIKNLPNLKYVIIPIDYFTLHYSGIKEGSAAKLYHHWNLKDGMVRSNFLKRYHFFTCGLSFYDEVLKKQTYDSSLGYEPQHNDFSKKTLYEQKEYCKNRIDGWNKFWIDTMNTNNIQYRIQKLITLLKAKKIHTIFVTMPVSEKFSSEYDMEIVKKNSLFIQKIIKDSNSLFINLESYKQFKTDTLFMDGDHLNDKGATIATLEIRNRILKNFQNINK